MNEQSANQTISQEPIAIKLQKEVNKLVGSISNLEKSKIPKLVALGEKLLGSVEKLVSTSTQKIDSQYIRESKEAVLIKSYDQINSKFL